MVQWTLACMPLMCRANAATGTCVCVGWQASNGQAHITPFPRLQGCGALQSMPRRWPRARVQEASLFGSDDDDDDEGAAAPANGDAHAAGQDRFAEKEDAAARSPVLHVPARLLNNTAVLLYRWVGAGGWVHTPLELTWPLPGVLSGGRPCVRSHLCVQALLCKSGVWGACGVWWVGVWCRRGGQWGWTSNGLGLPFAFGLPSASSMVGADMHCLHSSLLFSESPVLCLCWWACVCSSAECGLWYEAALCAAWQEGRMPA